MSPERRSRGPNWPKHIKPPNRASEHRKLEIVCPTCNKNLMRTSLNRHLKTHTQSKFQCNIRDCTYTTPQRGRLEVHINSHLGVKPYKCFDDKESCNFSTNDPSSLIRHRRRRHGYKTKAEASIEAQEDTRHWQADLKTDALSTSHSSGSGSDIFFEQFQYEYSGCDAGLAMPGETDSSYFDPAGPLASSFSMDNATAIHINEAFASTEFSGFNCVNMPFERSQYGVAATNAGYYATTSGEELSGNNVAGLASLRNSVPAYMDEDFSYGQSSGQNGVQYSDEFAYRGGSLWDYLHDEGIYAKPGL